MVVTKSNNTNSSDMRCMWRLTNGPGKGKAASYLVICGNGKGTENSSSSSVPAGERSRCKKKKKQTPNTAINNIDERSSNQRI